jgi:HK97 family phage portal protein
VDVEKRARSVFLSCDDRLGDWSFLRLASFVIDSAVLFGNNSNVTPRFPLLPKREPTSKGIDVFGALLDMLVPTGVRKHAAAADGWNIGPWYNSRAKTQSNVVVNEELALTLSACWCASRVLDEGVADRDLITYQRTSDDDSSRKEAIGNTVHDLLRYFPNELMGSTAFRTGRTLHQVNMGNGFAEIERDPKTEEPIALWPIHPGRVRPVQPGDKYRDGRPIPMGAYLVRNNDGGTVAVLAKNMLHYPGAHAEDGIWGKSVVSYARESFGVGIAGDRQVATNLGNGNTPRMALIDPDLADQEQRREFRENWKTMHGSPDSGELAILWHRDAKLEQLSFSAADAQFLELLDYNRNQIACWYRVPPHMLADLKDSKYATVEALGLEFVIYCLYPWCKRAEEQYNLKLFRKEDRGRFFVQHDFNGLLRGDMQARMNAYRTGIMIGVLTVNECRRLENMNGLGPSGDKAMFPANMVVLEDLIAGKVSGAQGGTKPGQPGSDHTGAPNDGGPMALPPMSGDGAAAFDAWTRKMLTLDRQELYRRLDSIEASLKADYRAAALPAPQPAVEDRKKAEQQKAAAEVVLRDAISRILTKEAKAADRAAASKDFDAWLEQFYATHEALAVEELRTACQMAKAVGIKVKTKKLASRLCADSKKLLLNGYNTLTKDRFSRMLADWPTVRADREAKQACGGPGSGVPGPCPEGKEDEKSGDDSKGNKDGKEKNDKQKSNSRPLSKPAAKAVEKLQTDAKSKSEKAVADFVNSDAWKGPKGEEGAKAVKDQLSNAYAKAEVTINADPEDLARILGSGSLKNAFETGAKGPDYLKARAKQENEALGAGEDVENGDRPKYAAVNWENNLYGAASVYGDATIVLNKDKLDDRTTMTNGNSFGHRDDSGVGTPQDPYHAMLGNGRAMAAAGIDPSGMKDVNPAAYNEQQIWGDVPLDKDNVKEIRMPSLSSTRAGVDQFMELAAKAGIPVRFFHDETGETMSYETAKQRANDAAAKAANKGWFGWLKKITGG